MNEFYEKAHENIRNTYDCSTDEELEFHLAIGAITSKGLLSDLISTEERVLILEKALEMASPLGVEYWINEAQK